ncbi:MAG: GrpB family protein [Bacillus sp. (in: firmicutes)]
MRKVEVVEYKKDWKRLFKEESNKLKRIFGKQLLTIHHIGSTSVPGLKAKPIIDIMPIVKDINRVAAFNHEMTAIGYEAKGENGIPGRALFQKGGECRTHHVHVYEDGSKEIKRHLAFRDYLQTHRDDASRYGLLKEELALAFPYNIDAYMCGKHDMAAEMERKALLWYENNKTSKNRCR